MLADQLSVALQESVNPVGDAAKSFNILAKNNQGLWKSEKQARFLLNLIRGPFFRDRAAEAWAHRHRFDGKAFSHMQIIKGYGTRSISKARFWAQVFVVDPYGLVARGKVKVDHPKGGQGSATLNWSQVDVTFKRTAKPTISVDVDRELATAVVRNQPTIDLIKKIPGWEGKDILVDFIQQLEGGRPLTPGQLGVVQRMAPAADLLSGSKDKWKDVLRDLSKLLLKMLETMRDSHLPHERARVKEYEAVKAKDGYWGWTVPDPDDLEKTYNGAIRELKSKGYLSYSGDYGWLDSKLFGALVDLTHGGPGIMGGTEEIHSQVSKAIKSKKPSKKSLKIVSWVSRLASKLDSPGEIKRVADISK